MLRDKCVAALTRQSNRDAGGPGDASKTACQRSSQGITFKELCIYSDDHTFDESILDAYSRADNALWIPEAGLGDSYAPLLFEALGHGAISFSPFGVDRVEGKDPTIPLAKAHAVNFELLAPMAREIARLNFEEQEQATTKTKADPSLRSG